MYVIFLLKNILLLLSRQGYGHYRYLRKFYDPRYRHDIDKHPIRNKHYGTSGWKSEKRAEFRERDYDSYDEYVTHQKQKFDEILKSKGGFSNLEILAYRLTFFRRFRHLHRYLPKTAKILCAGARQGTEVEVLRDLGFKEAFGIDLNPGPHNKYVITGDFMKLSYPDQSLDMIYSNSVDHAFDIEKFFAEHARALKPGGYALYDLTLAKDGGPFEAIQWDKDEAVFLIMLRHFQKVVMVETEKSWKWVLLQKN